MATVSAAKRSIEVTLVRPEGEASTFTLPEGATLGDLLRAAGATIRSPNVRIEGRPIEDMTILKAGMTIVIMPEPAHAPGRRTWLDTVGMFEDDADFQAMVDAGKAYREADRRAALEEGDREDS
jgi:hypothetical protein